MEYYPLLINYRKIELGIIKGQQVKLPKYLLEIYNKELEYVENTIIFIEFLKEFVCIFSHKDKFETLVEEMFGIYSNLLDDYYDQNPHNNNENTFNENNNHNENEEGNLNLNRNPAKIEWKKNEIDEYFNRRISTINEIEEDFHL
jgi:hypothetical protein